jgi:SAM-dependent methyltransferase
MNSRRLATLPARAWTAWRARGAAYLWHKTLRRLPGLPVAMRRRLLYAEPRAYWTHRGGSEYYLEQEGQPGRSRRSSWMAEQIARCAPGSVLEVGCGYGKQLRALREHLDVPLYGLDFSASQLDLARGYLQGLDGITLIRGDGAALPFPDHSIDLVLTSAVILHNPPEVAEAMRREIVRVARRWAVHNEDTNTSYNRFGYDTAGWYRERGIELAACRTIPGLDDESITQFCVACLEPAACWA